MMLTTDIAKVKKFAYQMVQMIIDANKSSSANSDNFDL